MVQSKFINVDLNALVEWIYDDQRALIEDYFVVEDSRTLLHYFVNDESNGSSSFNGLSEQLHPISESNNKWSPINPIEYPYLKRNLYSSPPLIYNKVRIHFPIGFTLADKVGFMTRIQLLGNDNQYYTISNNFYDKSDPTRLTLNPRPFFYNAKMWGTYVEFSIPDGQVIQNQTDVNQKGEEIVRLNSINFNLTNGVGLQKNQPFRLIFYWLNDSNGTSIVTNRVTVYNTTAVSSWAVPTTPSYRELSVVFEEGDGDYYQMYCIYNGSQQLFVDLMEREASLGIRNQLTFEIAQYEDGVLIENSNKSLEYGDPWDKLVTYRPIFFTNAIVAEIVITAVLTNISDGTSVTRKIARTYFDSEIARYGKKLSAIKVDSIEQIRVYQNRKDNSTALGQDIDFIDSLSFNEYDNFYADKNAFEDDDPDLIQKRTSALRTRKNNNNSITTIKVSTPLLVDRYNISAQSSNQTLQNNIWWGNGLLEIVIYPTDNIIAFNFALIVTTTTFQPYNLPLGDYYMTFSGGIETPLYMQAGTNNIDLKNGKLVFLLSASQVKQVKKNYESGSNQFYIVLKGALGSSTTLYGGSFIPFDSVDYRNRQNSSINSSLNGVIPSGAIPTGITTPVTATPTLSQDNNQTFTARPNSKNVC